MSTYAAALTALVAFNSGVPAAAKSVSMKTETVHNKFNQEASNFINAERNCHSILERANSILINCADVPTKVF
jgi:hypothetical protein